MRKLQPSVAEADCPRQVSEFPVRSVLAGVARWNSFNCAGLGWIQEWILNDMKVNQIDMDTIDGYFETRD